ncbi:YesL family protein [Fictibacillus sp. 18YEL24]|uniref:YesL family protein n=1 Tax=Fictibacillus sp. 18YEL24 TaxID=2745875 RepID=UPI0018CCC64F|nr:DUF624 domain-containing protein [Fictibacillus sp. 18YEL24]MBH0168328.1 DUF624 domain-containing protein [Fictibacillus sp. 18YEL24]
MKRLITSLTSMLNFIGHLVILNGLWLLFTLLGLIAFGLFPSTAALFAVIRKSHRSKSDLPLIKDYWFFYKKEFIQSNFLGFIILFFAYFYYIDWRHVQSLNLPYSLIGYLFLLCLLLISCTVFIYLFPIRAHYEIALGRAIKMSLILGLLHPFSTLSMLMIGGGLYYLFSTLPILFLFFGGSAYTYILMKSALMVFNKNESKLEAA